MAAINIDVGANTRQAEKDIQKLVSRSYNINLKTRGDQPLGRITGKVNEFTKSLDASNARVIAFGASAGIIFGVQRAFTALASSVIETQKALADINVILNVSSSELNKFGSNLFSIAKNTGQSFAEVAKAATEFSRQGLGVAETLKRTNEALILSRLSGLDAAKSPEIVNKFANVDAAFAVSSADLAEAISRVGSSAAQSGVSLNELIAIVTSAQQTTARGGAVIGNSFKTIFTRLQRTKVVDLLEGLGVNTRDSSGEIKSTINLLTDLAKVYDQLGTLQQAEVAEKVGGVFQINILKSALADLGKEYSIYNNALQVAASTTDQAIRRNEELNKTYAAQLNALRENAKQAGAGIGERLFGPAFDRVVGNTNEILGGINESDGQGVGATLGKGILDGLGQVIAGPGLALIGGIFIKLFSDLAKFATGSLKELLNLNTASKQQQQLQQSVAQILQKNPELFKLMQQGSAGLNKGAEILLNSLRAQTLELQKQEAISAKIASQFIRSGSVTVAGGVPVAKTSKPGKAGGYIPNFAEEFQAKVLGATSNVKAVRGVGKIGGKSFEANNQELQIRNFANTGETAVIPKYGNGIKEATKMIANGESGSILDKSDRNKAKGFIPNFAVDTIANLQKQASRSAGLLQNLYNVGDSKDKGIKDEYFRPNIKRLPLPKNVKEYTKEADNIIKNIRNQASSNPSSVASIFQNSQYRGIPISKFTDKIKPQTLLDPKKDRSNNTNIKGAMGEIDSQRRFGSKGRVAEKQGDLFGADFLVKKQGGSYLVESKITQRKVSDNILIAKALQYEGQTAGGKYKNRTIDELKLKNIILSYAPFKNLASGFIPNFAQTKNPPIQLGNLDKIPNKLGKKVLSLIYPGLSGPYELAPATATYLKQQYTGNIPVAGINKDKLKSQLPDLDTEIDDFLVKQANQFGQSLGGFNFLKSADELPNAGAAKGAVGVAFEGGITTLLQNQVRKQNAGIDFRKISPRLRSIFNNAPGIYDAKRSPELTNEVLQKLLNETKPGATVQKTSGKAGAAYLKERSAAVDQLRKEGVTGSVAIRQALRDRFGIVGKAAGFIPNFAKTITEARERAIQTEKKAGKGAVLDEYKGMQYVRQPGQSSNFNAMIKKDHPEGLKRAIQNSAASQGLARGFVPNFAPEDTQAADLGSSLGALATQIGFLGFGLQGFGDSYKQSLTELTQKNKEAGRVTGELTKAQKAANTQLVAMGKITGEEAQARGLEGRYGATGGQRAGAAIGAGGIGLTIAAPIIAETIANAIGKETKADRTLGAGASALGQVGSFAGLGAMLAPNPLVGAAIGGSAGALLGLIDVIKQASTDIPELSAAAQKASENLTKINDAGQKVQTSFEQIKQLREAGQGERAGQLEADLLSFIRKEFRDTPELVSGASAAVINQDFISLQKVIGENTNAVLENTLAQQKNLAVTSLVESLPRSTGNISEKQFDKIGENFSDIINITQLDENSINQLSEISRRSLITDGGPTGFATDEANKIFEEFENLLTQTAPLSGLSKSNINDLVAVLKLNPSVGLKLIAELADPANKLKASLEATGRNSGENNKVIALITKTLQTVQSNYAKLARQSQSALDLQLLGESSIRKSGTNIGVSQFETKAVQEELFGITTPAGRADSKTQGELLRIEGDFANTIKDSVGETISLIGSAFLEQQRQSFAALSTIGGDDNAQKNAEANLETAGVLAEAVKQGFDIEQFRSLLDIGDPTTFTGFDVEAKLSEIAQALQIPEGDPEGEKRLDAIREAINKTNQELVKNKAVLIEQKTILANQKFQESLRELITSINSAFGGLQAFINDDISITEGLDKAVANLKIIGEPTGEKGIIEVGRNLQRVVSELSKITGRNLGPELGQNSAVISAIRDARALDIENQLTNVISGLGGVEGEAGREILEGFRRSIAEQIGEPEAAQLSDAELIKRYSKTVATQQVEGENKVGELNQKLIEQAKSSLPPELQKLLGEGGDSALSLLAGDTNKIISLQFSAANKTLEEILKAIQNTQNSADLKIAKFLQDPFSNATLPTEKPVIDRTAPKPELPKTYSSGSIPLEAIPAMIAEKRDVKRGVGGARPSDRPTFIPNFNGAPVVANIGEQLIKNYMGTGEDALLTRDMQRAAKGSLPKLDTTELDKYLDDPRHELESRILSVKTKIKQLTPPVSYLQRVELEQLERELFLLQNPKAEILTKDGVKPNPYFDKDGKYIRRKKKKPEIKNPFKNMAEGFVPKSGISGSSSNQRITSGMGSIMSALDTPEWELYQRISELEYEIPRTPEPGDFGYQDKDYGKKQALRNELFLLKNPKFKPNPYFDKDGKYIRRKKKKPEIIKNPFKNMAEGYIPNFAEGFVPMPEIPYSLIKQANEINQKYKKELDPLTKSKTELNTLVDIFQEEKKKSFYNHMAKRANWDENRSKQAWNNLAELDLTSPERDRRLKEYFGWDPSLYKDNDQLNNLIKERDKTLEKINEIEKSYDKAAEPLVSEFRKTGANASDFLNPRELYNLSTLFYRQKEWNKSRQSDKQMMARDKLAAQRAKERARTEAVIKRTEAVIKRGRETLARSYEMTGDRYEIDEYGGAGTFTVDAQRLGLRGPGAGGTFNIATSTDRAGIKPTTEIRRAERTTQANAKFMLQSLVEAYTQALSGQEGFYNRPTRQSMDQKRALMAKTQEFKRLYEQGRYESLREIYEKHEKNDPVKQAYAEWAKQGIDPNEGYDRAMAYGRDQEALYQRARNESVIDEIVGIPKDQRSQGFIDGRPTREVLAEGRTNRPSDPAYDRAMIAAGLDPKTGSPLNSEQPTYGPGGAGLIDGRPAQEVLREMEKNNANARIKNYSEGFLPKINSFMDEVNAGFAPNEVYQKRQPEVQGLNNPEGMATFNTPQEKNNIAKERMAMANRMYIPNFANSVPEFSAVSVSLGGLTVNEAQTGGKTQDYAKELGSEIEARVGPLITQIKSEMDQKYGRAAEMVASAERQGILPRVAPRTR
jgi:hypothetical protein